MKEVISRRLVTRQVRHHESLALTYISNPKAGSSGIKAAMWAQIDRNTGHHTLPDGGMPHKLSRTPFVQSICDTASYDFEKLGQSRFFTVVRNPFTRTLSGYLNKIGKNSSAVWRNFCKRYGVDPDETRETYSFKKFLHTIAKDEIDQLDPHFRPQYINTLYPFVPFSFIGKLERMSEAYAYMESCGISLSIPGESEPSNARKGEPGNARKGGTGANEKIALFYDDGCEAIVRELYRDDFKAFGYSDDLKDVQVVAPVPERGPMRNRLLEFIEGQEGMGTRPGGRWGEIRARMGELMRRRGN